MQRIKPDTIFDALEKMEYISDGGMIVCRSKIHKSLKRNHQIMPGAQWLALLLQHVPDQGEHLVQGNV